MLTDHPTTRTRLGLLLLLLACLLVGCGARRVVEAHTASMLDPFDERRTTVARLDPALREAIQSAAGDAISDGVRISLTSGWRSARHQERLFDEAVRQYGSAREALRHVATPATSAHVTGDAVDVGPEQAQAWLRRHGAAYGLCQVFANEPWHYELATEPGGTCPRMVRDNSVRQGEPHSRLTADVQVIGRPPS